MMKSALKFVIIALICGIAFVLEMYAQTVPAGSEGGNKNFPFSQNPKKKARPAAQEPVTPEVTPKNDTAGSSNQVAAGDGNFESRSSAEKLASVARARNATTAKAPTEIYRVGTGDVLDIKLLNAENNESTLFTVMEDGSVDYPLAGGVVPVGGMTVDEIEEVLIGKVTLYENPNIAVSVRSFTSHSITVLGQVDRPGNKALRREAMPLYAVLAEVLPQPAANRAMIARADRTNLTINLEDPGANDTLIYPGDVIRITSAAVTALTAPAASQFYYINGVQSPGEKAFRPGLTLTQAILACGGLTRESAAKVTVSRQNEQGLLVPATHNLKDIREGKSPDPVVQPGDRIEIKN